MNCSSEFKIKSNILFKFSSVYNLYSTTLGNKEIFIKHHETSYLTCKS